MNRLFEAEAFSMVVDGGSFTAAAQRLGITKSYTSKLVTRLEDRLGVRLLQRTTRKLALTEPGRAYYERCSEVMRSLEEAEAEATLLQTELRGNLRLSLPMAFGLEYLSAPLAELKARYPDLTIEADFTDRRVDLLAEGVDVAVRAGAVVESGLLTRKLATADRLICASPEYLARRGEPLRPEDLGGHECLRYAYHTVPGVWSLKGPGGPVDVVVSGSLVSNNSSMLLEAAYRGLGLVFMPVFLTAEALRDGRLRRVLPGYRATVALQAVFPHARHVPRKVRAFVDFLVERFRQPAWADWNSR